MSDERRTTMEKVEAWAHDPEKSSRARIAYGGRGGSPHVGHLSTGGVSGLTVVSDRSGKYGREHQTVGDRHLGLDFPRLEIKVGHRFKAAAEVIR